MSVGSATSPPARGRLRVYLGAAPGVGKTHAMLDEGVRRARRGTRVVTALVETHDRPRLQQLLAELEQVPPQQRGPACAVDMAEVLDREPQVVLVDDLGATNPDGCPRRHRWEDVEVLLDRGIDVVTTVDVSQIESLADVVRRITGTAPGGTVPDEVVRRADQVELVDMAPEALRRRLAHGTLYPAEKVDAALTRYYRVGNLAALRELALLWLADRVDADLESYRRQHGIEQLWATRERIVVALTGGRESEALLRRGARIASRTSGGELHAVHVSARGGATSASDLARLRSLTEELGGSYHLVLGDDPAAAVLDLARGLNATQVVVGESSRSRWRRFLSHGVSERLIRGAGDLDVLVVTHGERTPLTPTGRRSDLGRSRLLTGWLLALAGPLLLTAAMEPLRSVDRPALEAMAFLALTVVVALVGGWWPAATSAVVGTLLLNWFFTDPLHTLSVAAPVNILVLVVFLVLGGAVARVVDQAATRSRRAERLAREAEVLAMLNRTLLSGPHTVHGLLRQVNETFGAEAAALLRREGKGHTCVESVGVTRLDSPGDVTVPVSADLVLTLRGATPAPHEQRVLGAFATHLKAAADKEALARRAEQAEHLEAGNRVRTALLSAVSHDLRTPLAGVKAAVSSLRSLDVEWTEEERAELLATIEASTDRLSAIVANLLDLSRIDADAVRPVRAEVDLTEVVARSLQGVAGAERVRLRAEPAAPAAVTDPGLAERVLANLVGNALAHAPGPVDVVVAGVGRAVQVRVVDRGPGVPEADKERMFTAFQRLGDQPGDHRDGLGLGLAVARGLVEAMGGSLDAEDTPGGGLTMVVELPALVAQPVPGP